MSVKVNNVSLPQQKLTARDLQEGVLYKQVSVPGVFDTVYTKSASGVVVWFEQNRIGVSDADNYLYEVAPAGTTVTLSN